MGTLASAPSEPYQESLQSHQAFALKLEGDRLYDASRPREALRSYEKALEYHDVFVDAGAAWGAAAAYEALGEYEAAVRAYDISIKSRRDALPVFERAQALRQLHRWGEAREGYLEAADRFNMEYRDKRRAEASRAQAAFCAFEFGDVALAESELERMSRRIVSSDLYVAHATVLYAAGDRSKAESVYSDACELPNAQCGHYRDGDTQWLLEYRRWTPKLVSALDDFINLR
ncbi:hypothetical protein CYMTET_20490 [Cymbomonas tetramitiformis]|uniref:Tetratricopeptide repeat protein n=1 Tax=Cymbomonas tetramitiformis TaxID=36881 RepID=A0AAE0L2A8_9CHLO|nr:hypothetical protein CYMTET_22333 [Cymbomonas tetramitiformis]KAK3271145.1 hypothetical protein CYMTET_20490 [Cymbomonas tetramitiformis]